MLDPVLSRGRQGRLLEAVREEGLDGVAIGGPSNVYYLSGHLPKWLHFDGFVLLANGKSWLTAANRAVTNPAIDEATFYEAQWLATLRQEQPSEVAGQMRAFLKANGARRVGIDASAVTSQLTLARELDIRPIDPALWRLRRRKDADELTLIRQAIACCSAMFKRAREIVRPGVLEIDVFGELHAVAVKTAGEPLAAYLGNDFTCGGGGGPPRKDRRAAEGELYILDLGPCVRGYFSDAARTFAVSEATPQQREACEAVQSCFGVIEKLAHPGARCREIYDAVSEHLKRAAGRTFSHHLGHGIGLNPHEYPHFNPKWDDGLMEGEVFAVEPGVYGADLKSGIRIENDYVVTKDGVERLIDAAMEL